MGSKFEQMNEKGACPAFIASNPLEPCNKCRRWFYEHTHEHFVEVESWSSNDEVVMRDKRKLITAVRLGMVARSLGDVYVRTNNAYRMAIAPAARRPRPTASAGYTIHEVAAAEPPC